MTGRVQSAGSHERSGVHSLPSTGSCQEDIAADDRAGHAGELYEVSAQTV